MVQVVNGANAWCMNGASEWRSQCPYTLIASVTPGGHTSSYRLSV